ncbi:tRNA pseudouridine(38/39) synthase [Monosporozyma servazzii]
MGLFSKFFKGGLASSSSPNHLVNVSETLKYNSLSRNELVERLIDLEKTNNKLQNDISTYKSGATTVLDESTYAKKRQNIDDSSASKKKNKKVKKSFDFSKHNTRFVAFKFAYLGWNYNGLAIQKEPTTLPTVEGTILEAMNKCKLVPSMVPQDYKFSRCGRTDKGVSAMNQVISLRVRSNLTDEEQKDPSNDEREIQYVHILNQLLPDDIRISAVSLRPPEKFDARFSCQSRHYKYLFNTEGLNLEKMTEAAKIFEGEHDFRNFCKVDGSKQITNYHRRIYSARIMPVKGDFYCFDLVGSAFLWHQVRCMMANLFLVGQELEDPSLISDMLNINMTPQKPVYDMASDIPLILYDCKFPEMEWLETNVNDFKAIKYGKAVEILVLNHQLKASIVSIFRDTLPSSVLSTGGKVRINTGDGKGQVLSHYKKMKDRDVMQPVDVINEKYKRRKANKKVTQD